MTGRPEWVGTIPAVVGQTYAEITPFGSEITQVRADVMSLLDRLQDTVTATGDDDTGNFGAAERAERIACNSREEVRGRSDTLNALVRAQGEQINALVRQVKHLQSDLHGIRGETQRRSTRIPGMAAPPRHARGAVAGTPGALDCAESAAR